MFNIARLSTNEQLLLIVILVFVTMYLSKKKEKFQGLEFSKPVVTKDEYIQEIRNLSSYVGPYIGDLYSYLRAKYFDPEKNVSLGPRFQPAAINDPTLADPLMPIARSQIRSWIDSWKLRMKKKYGDTFIADMKTKYDLDYLETDTKVLKIVYVDNGTESVYLV